MYSIGKFAKLIGRSIETLRSWVAHSNPNDYRRKP